MFDYAPVEFKPIYAPFDYSFLPCREYIPLQEIEYSTPRPRTVLPVYREIVYLQESDADEFITMLSEQGEDYAIKCLTEYYDYGDGMVHKIPPWSENDKVARNSQYVLVINEYIPYIALYSVE